MAFSKVLISLTTAALAAASSTEVTGNEPVENTHYLKNFLYVLGGVFIGVGASTIYHGHQRNARAKDQQFDPARDHFSQGGILYFFENPDIWPLYGSIIVPQTVFTLGIYAVMYLSVYPLYALLSFLAFGPFGVVSSFFTVLQYSNMMSNFLISMVFMPGVRDMVFDAVLSREGQADMVLQMKIRRKTTKATKAEKAKAVAMFFVDKLPRIILHEILILLVGMIPSPL
ncbi:hypothetical protein CA3LBN_001640 [Candidozyma haemuli]|uniref:Uncharacterized protein n=1 Tax=Candidozyma haemuli TaxID=45357 RepID=A0ABX8I2A6_9ASCO|nr:hypothetical protein CA3LBN_001640 [[Candida] haemuloni]